MTLLAANCSPALLALLEREPDLVDLVKMYPRTLLAHQDALRGLYQAGRILLHGLVQTSSPGDDRFAGEFDPHSLLQAIKLAGSRYLSVHLGYPAMDLEAVGADIVLERIVADVRILEATTLLPVHLENEPVGVPALGQPAFPAFTGDPRFISRVVDAAGCQFLLDLAHAQVTSWYRGETVGDYLSWLPLDRVEEIHISGPAVVDGVLDDWHEEIGGEGYELLRWALHRCRPRVLTLEYGGMREQDQIRSDPGALRRQMGRLRELLD
ncbi:MAG: DUF692 family protein [bacterium]|nr:DUF692 family protein [bacterium]